MTGISRWGVIDDLAELDVANDYRKKTNIRSSSVYQVTGNLFEELIFDLDRLKTDHAGSKIEFVVSAQAVQSENNGTSAETANGWPKEAE